MGGVGAIFDRDHANASNLTADLDGDGYNSLFEYATGLDPAVPNHGALPFTFDNVWIYFTYTRPAAVTDVTYQIEWADTFGSASGSTNIVQ